MVKLNERMEAGTDAAIPTTAEVNYVSQTIAKPVVTRCFVAPFRVGKKQSRAVLDSNGLEVVVFPKGLESWAIDYCRYLNDKNSV